VRSLAVGTTIAAAILFASPAQAIRPFITDDARVVGQGHAQLETWFRRDTRTLQHWAIGAFGPTDHIELSLGGVHGSARQDRDSKYAISGPLIQGKFLLFSPQPNRWPGVAFVAGFEPPLGRGGFEVPGWSAFGFVAFTESLFDDELLLIHANLGFLSVNAPGYAPLTGTWGLAAQLRTVAELHAVGEIFSGDPYLPGSGMAVQGGFRYVFNDHVQLDATVGGGLAGDYVLPVWLSSGVRVVSHKLF